MKLWFARGLTFHWVAQKRRQAGEIWKRLSPDPVTTYAELHSNKADAKAVEDSRSPRRFASDEARVWPMPRVPNRRMRCSAKALERRPGALWKGWALDPVTTYAAIH